MVFSSRAPSATPMVGMDRAALVRLIREHGPLVMGREIADGGVHGALTHGWDLTTWYVRSGPGWFLFYRGRDRRMTDEPRVLCVNAGEERRAEFEAAVADADADTLVLMCPIEIPF